METVFKFKRLVTSSGPLMYGLASRSLKNSLVRNSLFIMSTTVATSILGYLYWTIAARTYTVFDLGITSALVGVMTLTANLSNLGLGSTLVQTLPQRKSGKDWSITLNAALLTGSLVSLLAGLVVAVILPLISPQFAILGDNILFTFTFIIGVPLWTASTLIDATFTAERSNSRSLVRNVVFAVSKIVILVAALLLVKAGALDIFGSWVVGTALALLAGWFLLVRIGRGYQPVFRGTLAQVRSMLSSLAGHYFINVGGQAPMYLLPLLVTTRLSASDNGYFYTTWMLGGLFFMISPAVATSLFAEGSRTSKNLLAQIRLSFIIISILLGPAMLIFLVWGNFFLAIFGPAYAIQGGTLLAILVISAIPDGCTSIYTSVLRVQKRLRDAALLNLAMALLALGLAWLLLPELGIVGAGGAWLIARSAGTIWIGFDVWLNRQTPQAKPLLL